jgi:hypothetical protein
MTYGELVEGSSDIPSVLVAGEQITTLAAG